MKNVLAVLVFLGSVSVFANEGVAKPCQQIKLACEGAGFKKGDHKEKKGLYRDCMNPILTGQTVAGVTVGADVVADCKDKKMAHNKTK